MEKVVLIANSLVTLVLALKIVFGMMAQGSARFKSGGRPPEDEKLFLNPKGRAQTFGITRDEKLSKHVENETRWNRIVLNDLENIPIGLIIAWSSALSPASSVLHAILVVAFGAARVSHTFCYANAIQPYRAYSWFVGVISFLLLAVNGFLGALAS